MNIAVTLRLCPSRAEFQVFFAYSNAPLRDALLAAGVRYEAHVRGYLLSADPDSVRQDTSDAKNGAGS